MWYDRGHENPSVHPTLDRKRTQPDPSRLTLQRRLCLATIPGPVGVRSWRTGDSYSQAIRVPQANRTQHHPWLQCGRTRRFRGRLFASPSTAYYLSRRNVRGTPGSAASQPPRLWPRYQCVDVILGRPQISFQQGLTPRLFSGESVRRALKRLGKSWKRAKHWITSPDPHYLLKKTHAIG